MFSTLASILFVLSTPQPLFTASAPSNPGEAAQHIVAYVAAREVADIVGYVEAVDAWEAAQRPVETPPGPAVTAPQTSGSCTGFSVPDYIIQRESGGNPSAVNPSSGAYGCTQTLPSHYQPGGACAGLDMYSVDGQRSCTWILSDGGTNLQPWAL